MPLRNEVGWSINRVRYNEAVAVNRVAQEQLERDRVISVQAANNIQDVHGALAQ